MRLTTVFRVTMVYLIFGLLWIYFSDKFIDYLFSGDADAQSRMQTLKGFFYVGFTALLLYFLIKRYSVELNNKITRLRKSEQELILSEEKYKLLFEASPMPVIIFQPETDKILDVNNAAVEYYGYSPHEFSDMNILQIEKDEDYSRIEEKLNVPKPEGMGHSYGIHRHKKKDGKFVYVYTQGSKINYKGTKAHLLMANDITQQLEYIGAIEKQNEKLNEIAWMQSHVVRAPLASLMGLAHLLADKDNNETEQTKEQIAEKLIRSANELDEVIRQISQNADKGTYIIEK